MKRIITAGILISLVIGFSGCMGTALDLRDRELITQLPLLPMPRNMELTGELVQEFAVTRKPQSRIDLEVIPHAQGYRLSFDNGRPRIIAADEAGLFYARQTLEQLKALAAEDGSIPGVIIIDWPDFERRGVMLDISRDKVPTMETLYQMVDRLASWKINEFQLYTEHTFAFENHRKVWENASPMTAEEILALKAYCKERFIDLVPNQNSFGHMHRWLKHPEYRHLAECEKPTFSEWGWRSLNILSPAVPETLTLIEELYAELLPNFDSPYFNIGCDETIELGLGKSASQAAKIGKGRVYLNYLIELQKRAAAHGKRVQFWGDIILHHPRLISDLPEDMIAMIWGYEANHPFDSQGGKFRRAGLDFYVCPGTSSWNSITGRLTNMKGNLLNAAENGVKHGAMGFLNTNWGDYGNWQPLTFCEPGYLYGAALSWSHEANASIPIDSYLDRYLFQDPTGTAGRALSEMADVYLMSGMLMANNTAIHHALRKPDEPLSSHAATNRARSAKMDQVLEQLEVSLAAFNEAPMKNPERDLIVAEVEQAVKLLSHGAKLVKAKRKSGDRGLAAIDEIELKLLLAEIEAIADSHEALWVKRNRPGGLRDSRAKLDKIADAYRKALN